MKDKWKFLLFIPFLFFAAMVVGYLSLYKYYKENETVHFQRLPFQAVQKTEELEFDRTAHRWISRSKKRVPFVNCKPKGIGILFNGTGSLILKPGVTGRKGIFFHVDARSTSRQNISIVVSIKREKEIIFRETIQSNKKKKIYYSFSKIFKFTKNDTIIINSQGNGALITGDAYIYDLVEKEKRKYVFIIALDTMRGDKIGTKVNGIDLTPNLNRFKKDAVVFDKAYAQSSWTLPSFTSFFTGLYEFNHRIFRHRVLDAKKPFLIENFSEEYLTASINGGTWLTGKIGNSRGFDSIEVGSGAREAYASRSLFRKSIRFIDKNPVPSLFMFLHTYAIHAPYAPPEEFLLRLNKNPLSRGRSTFTKSNQYKINVPPEVRDSMVELYDAEIMAFDHYFGEFINYLKRNGIYDQSLIVFFSDHGEEFYDHLGWGHGHSLYNELIKVPLIIKFPRNKYKGKTIKENVGLIDVLPTLLDYLQIEQDREIDGISLLPMIEKGELKRKILVSSGASCPFFDQVPRRIAILFDCYKMIYNFEISEKDKRFFREAGLPPQVPKFEVFNLKNDPLEKSNLYPTRKELIKGFQKKLREIIKRVRFNLKQKKSTKVELSDEELERLKALGYL